MAISEKRLLQVAICVACLVPVFGGGVGVIFGPASITGGSLDLDQDNHFRFLSGLLLAIGLAYLSTVPDIEKQSQRFGVLTLLIVIGGFARLLSLLLLGPPSPPLMAALGMELVVTPLLALWQRRLASRGTLRALSR